jgi:hypothetical protein
MTAPRPPSGYEQRWASEVKRDIERRDAQNHKRGRDVEIGAARLILTSPNGTRYAVAVDNSGALTVTAI